MKKSIPKIREREGNEKNPFPQFGNGKGMKKSIPTIREWESEAIIPKNEKGMKKHNMTIKEKYLANMLREKEFWPKHS